MLKRQDLSIFVDIRACWRITASGYTVYLISATRVDLRSHTHNIQMHWISIKGKGMLPSTIYNGSGGVSSSRGHRPWEADTQHL